MQFNYTITPKAVGQITQFYCNVALKYRHAYSIEDMERNIRQAVFSAYLISDEPELALFTKGGQYERDGFHPNGIMTSYFSVHYVKK